MLERFYPDVYISSTYKIDFDQYYRQGYRGIIFDIDNTLVIHGAPADKRSAELIEKLQNMGQNILSLIRHDKKNPRYDCCDYDSHKNKKNLLILQHAKGRSSVLQIIQFQHIPDNGNGRLPFQMQNSQIFCKLICCDQQNT